MKITSLTLNPAGHIISASRNDASEAQHDCRCYYHQLLRVQHEGWDARIIFSSVDELDLTWCWAGPNVGCFSFFVKQVPACAGIITNGKDREAEEVAFAVFREEMAETLGLHAEQVISGLAAYRNRPLVVAHPSGGKPITECEWTQLGMHTFALAAAFADYRK